MGNKWTQQQKDAIESRGCSLLVSAAAGSGKTAVLVERIVQMISSPDDPVDIERLLVVTFTNAAAAQMRERIGKRLDERIGERPQDGRLRRQKMMLSGAPISTIHSLCRDLIENHFDVLDIDPSFRIGDDKEIEILKADTAKDVLEVYYSSGDAAFAEFARCYASARSDQNIVNAVLDVYRMADSFPDPDYWLDSCLKWYQVDPGRPESLSGFARTLLEIAKGQIRQALSLLERARALCREDAVPDSYTGAVEEAAESLEKLLPDEEDAAADLEKYEKLRAGLEGFKLKNMPPLKAAQKTETSEQVSRLRSDAKKIIQDLRAEYFPGDLKSFAREMAYLYPYVKTLCTLVRSFARQFRQEKKDRNMLDFSDLEHEALRLLVRFERREDGSLAAVPTDIADQLSGWYQAVICDEYQDSNRVQELILDTLSGGRQGKDDRFMVGDVKQSIYGFRLADPTIFMEKYDRWNAFEQGGRERVIHLHNNFRSRRHILDAVNFIFSKIMRRQVGGIEYDQDAALAGPEGPGIYPPAQGLRTASRTEMLLINYSGDPAGEDADQEILPREQVEASVIADRIVQLTDPESGLSVYDKDQKKYRPLQYRDIAILLRSPSGDANGIVNTLAARGIPAAAELKKGFLDALEIRVMKSVLSVIDNPHQDIPLAAVLVSPIVGMTGEEMARMRGQKEGDLFDAVQENEDPAAGSIKTKKFLKSLEKLRRASHYMEMNDLIRLIYDETVYYDYVRALPAGRRRQANLDLLLQMAVNFAQSRMSGLFRFLRYLENIEKTEQDIGEASVPDEEGGLVRVMSIHKSKGLEFPIVFLGGMGKQFNMNDNKKAVLLDPHYGIGMDAVNCRGRVKVKTIFSRIISRQIRNNLLAEELRLLYVAMTRAEELLIMVGTTKDADKALKDWSGTADAGRPFTAGEILKARSYLDWVIPCIWHSGSGGNLRRYCPDAARVGGRQPEEGVGLFEAHVIEGAGLFDTSLVQAAEGKLKREDLERRVRSASDTESGRKRAALLQEDSLWQYPWKEEAGLKGKYTVSELKRAAYEQEEEAEQFYPVQKQEQEPQEEEVPAFMLDGGSAQGKTEEKFTPAQRGTVWHRFLELLDFAHVPEKDLQTWVKGQLQEMTRSGRLTEKEAALISPRRIEGLLASPLGRRMAAAAARGDLHRESQFMAQIPASLIRPGISSGRSVIIQGVVDAWFAEDGKICLLDYKTDYVTEDNCRQILTERYAVQLDYYSYALEKITGLPAAEKILYSLRLGREIPVR